MALKDKWINKVDGVDDVLAQDINDIAQGVVELEKDKASNDIWKENVEAGRLPVGKANNASADAQGNVIHSTYATKGEVSEQIGDINAALDAILAIQNSLIGGDA